MNALGEIAYNRNDTARAESHLTAGLELHEKVDNKLGVAKALDDLGRLAIQEGNYERAAGLLESSLRLRRERGSPEGIAVGLLALGEVKRLQGDYTAAEKYTHESLACYRQLNHISGTITALYNLAQMRQKQGDPGHAISLYLEALSLLRDLESEETELVLDCLIGLAQALYASKEVYQAAQAIGAHERLAAESKVRTPKVPANQITAARTVLGETDWLRATDSGRAMTLDEFLAEVSKRKAYARL